MAHQSINDAKHWRDRASEMRVLSDEIKDPQAQRMMLKLPNDYEKLAGFGLEEEGGRRVSLSSFFLASV